MLKSQIDKLIDKGQFPEEMQRPRLLETHISWIILCDHFVYKIKKPIHYSFLDFSTLDKRKFYCEREVLLNKRLTENIYIDVYPITENNTRMAIGNHGSIIEYCVKMVKMDPEKQMDKLAAKNLVKPADIFRLVNKIVSFHNQAEIIYQKDITDISDKFNDLGEEKAVVGENLGLHFSKIIADAINKSNCFIQKNKSNFNRRNMNGFTRDGHGDLHCKNIFLLPEPQPFDCIEFNDDYRRIDVLNEIAFLCMDLEAFGSKDLSDLFINHYNKMFPSIKTDEDFNIFVYYKSYRANIRAKVNCLRALGNCTPDEKHSYFQEAKKYLLLLEDYMRLIS